MKRKPKKSASFCQKKGDWWDFFQNKFNLSTSSFIRIFYKFDNSENLSKNANQYHKRTTKLGVTNPNENKSSHKTETT